ncbi:RpiB/LacA/LacB family sugar-phosphate isomerase [Streptomyces malaysiensis]|uniref:RpiB/LacA/LacB family sugar-phosphate isomerase n=1 Tax=Streptomyces malaysiensis TaxID=92644 RepID=UPI00165157C9|nr:RpiB/LacA/LacB family sugar-phosphate isomerase [Streptomyces malaysiensis]
MRIAIAADHNGFALKSLLRSELSATGHEVSDLGSHTAEEVDYPALCVEVCARVRDGRAERGIVLGGSGLGETIACNKLPGIRAGLCHDVWTAEISRGNNDSNVLVLPAKRLTDDQAREIVAGWLGTSFKGGKHARRVAQIAALEQGG